MSKILRSMDFLLPSLDPMKDKLCGYLGPSPHRNSQLQPMVMVSSSLGPRHCPAPPPTDTSCPFLHFPEKVSPKSARVHVFTHIKPYTCVHTHAHTKPHTCVHTNTHTKPHTHKAETESLQTVLLCHGIR